MIKSKDLFKEIETLEAVHKTIKDEVEAAKLKAQILTIKLLHNIRTNETLVMKHMGINLISPDDASRKE